jgi:ABC-type multidrug transport system ATPase subunit
MNYWLVRAKWGGIENKKAEFINNDEWINGYTDKYLEIVKRVETEDILLLAEDSTITHYGVCVDNPQDGRHLIVDKWILLNNPIYFPGRGSYIKTIVKINDNELINKAHSAIESTINSNDIKIKSIEIESFTVFKNKYSLHFSNNLNVIIGENNAGKTHLIKLIYSLIITLNRVSSGYIDELSCMKLLQGVFKVENLNNLINYHEHNSVIKTNFDKYFFQFEINEDRIKFHKKSNLLFKNLSIENTFIPSKEILSFYEGFISLFEKREISFDETYYHLAHDLSPANLKNIESYPVEYKLLCKLEEILEGKILLERGRFYLVSHKDNRKTEISLIAEGFRKIGMIAQLLANGSLTKNSILFWDEPETNLNPRLIRKMAEVLMELSRAGMQIFIATHSLFLVKEIEILRKKDDKVKYFGLGFDENKEIRVSQSENFEYLDDIVILDEELEQDSRFLSKEDK